MLFRLDAFAHTPVQPHPTERGKPLHRNPGTTICTTCLHGGPALTDQDDAKPTATDTPPDSDVTAEPPAEGAPEPESEITDLEARIAALEEEVAAERDRALRARADAENTSKRSARERAEAVKYGASGLARDLLEIVDNLERALASIPEDRPAKAKDVGTLREGVKLTLQELNAKFRRHDIQRIAPAPGDPFDPNYHQAVTQLARPDLPGGAVAELLQPGYRHHDRLLRAAVVATVLKEAAAAAPEASSNGIDDPVPGEPGDGDQPTEPDPDVTDATADTARADA